MKINITLSINYLFNQFVYEDFICSLIHAVAGLIIQQAAWKNIKTTLWKKEKASLWEHKSCYTDSTQELNNLHSIAVKSTL